MLFSLCISRRSHHVLLPFPRFSCFVTFKTCLVFLLLRKFFPTPFCFRLVVLVFGQPSTSSAKNQSLSSLLGLPSLLVPPPGVLSRWPVFYLLTLFFFFFSQGCDSKCYLFPKFFSFGFSPHARSTPPLLFHVALAHSSTMLFSVSRAIPRVTPVPYRTFGP